tara:strand:+ start:457 stop:1077 length:621 start_codon:yes stop_codon:yes gene_type:complete
LINLFNSGGAVMWPLLFLSIITLACIIERIIFWAKLSKKNNRISNLILESYENNSNQFLEFLKKKNNNPYSQILINIFNMNFLNEKDFEKGLEINLINKNKEFNKYGNIFNLTIAISPLLGLLGTVIGLMNSFSFIDLGSVGTNTKEVTGGISEALVSTAYGLIIAIFTISFSSYFNSCKRDEIIALREFAVKFQILFFSKSSKQK